GDHGPAGAQRSLVGAGVGAPSPAHRVHRFRLDQPVGYPGPAGLGPAEALRMGHPRLRRRADGARMIAQASAAPRASRSSPVPFSRMAGVSAPSRNTPCSVKVSVVPDGAGATCPVVTDTEISFPSASMT